MDHLTTLDDPQAPPCRGRDVAALRRYAVACRSSALVAGRAGLAELSDRLTSIADTVELALEDLRRSDLAAAA